MNNIETQRLMWFAGALYTHKKIVLGGNFFYRHGDFYWWRSEDGWKLQVSNPAWLYAIFVEVCNSYGMQVEDYFFGELLAIPNSRYN